MRSSLSLFLLLATPSITYAQCTKDTDCKGDRICEKGICTAPPATSFQTRNAPSPLLRKLRPKSSATGDKTIDPIQDSPLEILNGSHPVAPTPAGHHGFKS